ncbi:MAG: aminotransferase class V-fold PLP-dependent enzyme [Clostridia bacterium]|nr:aminotransferase class V-fold PLP-dependent enzyme [Clostridia bacterium]
MIYLDNAATTMHKPQQVVDAVAAAMNSFGNCARGTHPEALSAARTVYNARAKLGALFGCKADHVAFTCNSTEALNTAISGMICPGDHVISTDLEHNSVLRPLYRLEAEQGVEVRFVPADKQGNLNYGDFEGLFRPHTKAIVCTHGSNLTGNLLDVARIGRMAHAHGAKLIVDASQTAGCFPIDMGEMHIDVLCFTGHKGLMGPQGTGGICVAEGIELRPFKVGGSGVQSYSKTQPAEYPTRLEAGTLNGHGIAGLGAAVDCIHEIGIAKIHAHERGLMERFYERVKEIPGVTVYGDFSRDRAAIVALNIRDYDSGAVSDELSETYGIATRPGAHCAPRMHAALGTTEQGAVRFSFGWFNTDADVAAAIAAVKELAE